MTCARISAIVIAALALVASTQPAMAISHRGTIRPTGAAGFDTYGTSVAGAGDVNGDGFDDLIVGAPANDAGGLDAGRVYVYFGGPAYDDVADVTLTGVAGEEFGSAVAAAGDVNADGYDDFVVGASRSDLGATDGGRVCLYFGGPSVSLAMIVHTTFAGARFGFSVGPAGDVNDDGYDDVIVGAPFHDAGATDTGAAWIIFGPGPVLNTIMLPGAAAFDWFGYSVSGAGEVNTDRFDDVIVGAPAANGSFGRAYLYYGGVTPDITPDLTMNGAAANDVFGLSVDGAGDVNGDGFDDLIVGAYGTGTSGAAFIYYGAPAPDAVADVSLLPYTNFEDFGYSVAGAGDLDGDGLADVIVGARAQDGPDIDAGMAYVFLGGALGFFPNVAVLAGEAGGDLFGSTVAAAGDMDGDGFGEVVVGALWNDAGAINAGRAYVTSFYPYRFRSPVRDERWVVGAPATVRWDGHDAADLAISYDGGSSWITLAAGVGGDDDNALTITAPAIETAGARLRLSYAGQPVTRATSAASDVYRIVRASIPPPSAHRLRFAPVGAPGDVLGASVAGAGDVNGDGFPDWIVGAFRYDGGGPNFGGAFVHYGGPGADAAPDLVLTGFGFEDNFGVVAGAGDINGDGFDDLVVGAARNDAGGVDAGRAYVYYGGAGADAVPDLTLTGAVAGDLFGLAVAGAGDVNGDGFADVIVGALSNDGAGASAGRAYVYFGGRTADAVADLTVSGLAPGDFLGSAVAGAGDVNGDGFDDWLVGGDGNDSGGISAGAAFLYFGGPAPDANHDLAVIGEQFDVWGSSVAGAGDVNGDGFDDLIVSGKQSEYASVYLGGPEPDGTADLVLRISDTDQFNVVVSGAGDINADGYDDVLVGVPFDAAAGTNAGRVHVYFGGVTPDDEADIVLTGVGGERFGTAVSVVGDLNADGFADLLVGAENSMVGGTEAGRACLFDFNRYHVTAPNGGETLNVGATQTVSWLGAEPADLWLSVDGGATYRMLESGVGGSAFNSLALRVPHSPTRFARVRLTPNDIAVSGRDHSDSLFTIQTSVSLLGLTATMTGEGAEIAWSTEPGVGPAGLAGYRLYRLPPGAGTASAGMRIGPELIAEPRYVDAGATAGTGYRLTAVNGLMAELELGRVSLAPALTGLRAGPSPLRRGGGLTVSFAEVLGASGLAAGDLEVAVFDVNGRRVATLARGRVEATAGVVTLRWDGRLAGGDAAAPGIYFVRATAPSARFSHERKVVVTP